MPKVDTRLPDGPLVAWYGDDFTGAAAVMEVLTFAGLPSMLFLDPPTRAQLARFPGLRGIGLASTARTWSPFRMKSEVTLSLAALQALNPAILHYKVCSTLDSAPHTGSIGTAIEIGSDLYRAGHVPVLIAAPQMRRHQFFGHLFAGTDAGVFRLDRHPVMAHHPVTPMTEADVARHLSTQSDRVVTGCLTLEDLPHGDLRALPVPDGRIAVTTIDAIDAASEAAAGRLIWDARGTCPFVVGSQGVEYALVRHWQASGMLPPVPPPNGIGPAARTIVVSGSVSSVTADQIAWSASNGFAPIVFDATAACGDAVRINAEITRCHDAAMAAITRGSDPLIHTALGPDDPAIARFRAACAASDTPEPCANERIGTALGRLLRQLLTSTGPARAIVSGGDTSGHAIRQLGIQALSALAPTIPGAAICRAHADGSLDGLELALKGGQMGSQDYFGWVRSGGGTR